MRPSFEIDPGLFVPPSQRSGTGRHTLPDAPTALLERNHRFSVDGVADEFFEVGDAGAYEGGPALVDSDPVLDDPEPAPVKAMPRTPEMDARRARLARVVATVVGCFAAVLALGVVRASASEKGDANERASATAVHAVGAPASPVKTPGATVDAPPPAVAEPAPSPRMAEASSGAPEAARTSSVRPERAVPAAGGVAPRNVPAAVPPTAARTFVAKPVVALPSVANFAARAGEPAKSAGRVPTASFAPAH